MSFIKASVSRAAYSIIGFQKWSYIVVDYAVKVRSGYDCYRRSSL